MTRRERQEHYDEALADANEYHKLVKKDRDESEIQRALITLGNIYTENARLNSKDKAYDISKAERYYKEALDCIPSSESNHQKVDMKGNCYLNLANLASLSGKKIMSATKLLCRILNRI